jgi:CYTH domain-containing protein
MALEIERKFLVLDDSYKHEAFSSSHIRQGYICSERGRTVRIRIRDSKAYITIKGPSLDGGLSRYEFEQEIPLADAEHLLLLCEPIIIDKTRWLVKSGEHTFEVDEFHGENEGLVMAEVELNNTQDTPKIPISSVRRSQVTADTTTLNCAAILINRGRTSSESVVQRFLLNHN